MSLAPETDDAASPQARIGERVLAIIAAELSAIESAQQGGGICAASRIAGLARATLLAMTVKQREAALDASRQSTGGDVVQLRAELARRLERLRGAEPGRGAPE